MLNKNWNNHIFSGVLQSEDGFISQIIENQRTSLVFTAEFKADPGFVRKYSEAPEDFVFSERSRIARLGVQIKIEENQPVGIDNDAIRLTLRASSVISTYPAFDLLRDFLKIGFAVGRIVYCDPAALLTSEEVIAALNASELKLPKLITISTAGNILIAPHQSLFYLRDDIDSDILGRILNWEEGREILNLYQYEKAVDALTVLPGDGIITSCSMYLNEHFVVLKSTSELGKHLPATILDPIKTRGIKIFLEIVNDTEQPIVNPLIKAQIYRARKKTNYLDQQTNRSHRGFPVYSYDQMMKLGGKLAIPEASNGISSANPMAMIPNDGKGPSAAILSCEDSQVERPHPQSENLSQAGSGFFGGQCRPLFMTSKLKSELQKSPSSLALKYFPNLYEHREIINLVNSGHLTSLYFFEPSHHHGPFLSQSDHSRLQEYHSYNVDVHWVSSLTARLMMHTMRDGLGYFVLPERLVDFHRSMIFAFYGSSLDLTSAAVDRLGGLLDALRRFWGKNIGILTGGGSGVMGMANKFAKERGILSGANFLDITDQAMNKYIDFCQVFQSTCRHSRQKWFEITSFPIFNVGGIGTLEELGITLCNMKLSIADPVPIILFDTEGDGKYWVNIIKQIHVMVQQGRAPGWIKDRLVITNDPEEVIGAYRRYLQLF